MPSYPSSDDEFVQRRERVRALLHRYDGPFRAAALKHGMRYSDSIPGMGRAVYLKVDVTGGVFLEMIDHWLSCSETNPRVRLALWTRYMENRTPPMFILKRIYFDGGLLELDPMKAEPLLDEACREVLRVSNQDIIMRGKRYDSVEELAKDYE